MILRMNWAPGPWLVGPALAAVGAAGLITFGGAGIVIDGPLDLEGPGAGRLIGPGLETRSVWTIG